jgi:hypothetical protein
MVKYVHQINKEVRKMSAIFEFVMGILGIAGTDPEATSIVGQVFDLITGFFAA